MRNFTAQAAPVAGISVVSTLCRREEGGMKAAIGTKFFGELIAVIASKQLIAIVAAGVAAGSGQTFEAAVWAALAAEWSQVFKGCCLEPRS